MADELAELMFTWGDKWGISRPNGRLFVAHRRDYDNEGAVTYYDVFVTAVTAEALDQELSEWIPL
jgi:hypothetical protein